MGRESLANHVYIPKKAYILKVCACEGFSYVWRHRLSAPSLHRESTDSLILRVRRAMRGGLIRHSRRMCSNHVAYGSRYCDVCGSGYSVALLCNSTYWHTLRGLGGSLCCSAAVSTTLVSHSSPFSQSRTCFFFFFFFFSLPPPSLYPLIPHFVGGYWLHSYLVFSIFALYSLSFAHLWMWPSCKGQ